MSKIKTIILTVLALSAGFMFTGCNVQYEDTTAERYVNGYAKSASTNAGIKNIIVYIKNTTDSNIYTDVMLTNSNGYFEFPSVPNGSYEITLIDIDGSNNGGEFKNKTTAAAINNCYYECGDILMELKSNN